MSLLDNVRNWAARTALKAGQTFSFLPEWVKVSWMGTDFLSLITNGYKASSAVSACVRALAGSFPEPPLIAYKDTPEGKQPAGVNDALQKLIRNPNPDMGEAELNQFLITYASCGGNAYIWKERSKNGKVLYLWPFSDGQIQPIPGHSTFEGFVAGYKFDAGDGDPIFLSKNDVIQWKWMIDPEQPWKGIGAIEFAVKDINSDTESSRYTYAMFKSNAVPPVAITLVEGEELTDAKASRLRKAWLQRYGKEDVGAPAFLEAGMTIQKLGMNMQELDLSNLKNVPESRICASFGVPPVIALLYVGLKRSDYGDGMARKSFTETTLVALWRSFSSEMTSALSDEFGGGYTLEFDLSQVKALQENLNELWTRINTAVTNGYITRGEARRALGFKTGAEDNVYRASLINSWESAGSNAKALSAECETKNEIASQRALPSVEEKSVSATYGRGLQRIRKSMVPGMTNELNAYFGSLADRVVSRAGKALQMMSETKELPPIDELLSDKDELELEKILKRWFVAIAQASWETINLALGVTVAFDLTDAAVTSMLGKAGGKVTEITATTRTALQDALKYGNEQGWSIGQLVRGDENQAGIRAIVDETYKGRAETIARTELGNAQNDVTAERYKDNGIALVGVLDNGNDDDDDECKIANGQVWTLAYAQQNPLEHPNCTRCIYPIFDDVVPDRS